MTDADRGVLVVGDTTVDLYPVGEGSLAVGNAAGAAAAATVAPFDPDAAAVVAERLDDS